MTYMILERFLKDDMQVREPLKATHIVIHSTANPGATDEGHFKWLDPERRHGWAHYYGDWDSISQLVPEGFVAPANGTTANKFAISYEICEPPTNVPYETQERMFREAWDRAVWWAADTILRYGWDVSRLLSHADVTRMYPADTDHQDPIAFFARFGRKWDDFKIDVINRLANLKVKYPPAEKWQEEIIQKAVDDGKLSIKRHPNQPVVWWEMLTMLERYMKGGAQ